MNYWARFCASTLTTPPRRNAVLVAAEQSLLSARPRGATRSSRWECAIRSDFRSIARRDSFMSATSDKARWKRSTSSPLGGNYGWRVYEGTNCTGLDPGLCAPTQFRRADRAIRSLGRALFHHRRICLPRLGSSAAGGDIRIRRLLHGRNFLAGERGARPVARYCIEYFVVRGRRGGRNLCGGARWNGSSIASTDRRRRR